MNLPMAKQASTMISNSGGAVLEKAKSELAGTLKPALTKRQGRRQTDPVEQSITLSNAEKAAIIIGSLNVDVAKQIVNELDDDELRAFAEAFSGMRSVAANHLNLIAREFSAEIERRQHELTGGMDEMNRILQQIAAQDRIERVFPSKKDTDPQQDMAKAGDVWVRIEKIEEDRILGFLKKQKLSISAAIISRLGPEKSSALILAADADFARDILLELARRPHIDEETVREIVLAMEDELVAEGPSKVDYSAGGAVVGEIVNLLPAAKRDAFLSEIQTADEDIGGAVRRFIMTFEELAVRLPSSAAMAITRQVDQSILLKALKHGQKNAPDTVEFIFANISKRMGEQMREEMAEAPDLTEEDGEDAQRQVVSAIRRMADAGQFELIPRAE